MQIRLLSAGDEATLQAFLSAHRDSSMFLRANSHAGGLAYAGQPLQGIYAAVFRDGAVTAVAAHYWNGFLVVQAPEQAGALARACVEGSGRRVAGFAGPPDQVSVARTALSLDDATTALDKPEWLYGLDLADLIVPTVLRSGTVLARPPRPDERDQLETWRLAYDIELFGATDTPETRQRTSEFLDRQIEAGHVWVAVRDGVPVSLSAFNAALDDIVQLGGIYTPPERRGRGYAKAAVAHALLVARDHGVERAVLFTSNPSAARTYIALGFRHIGDYALVLFD